MAQDDVEALFRKLSKPAEFSKYLPSLEIGAYDARQALASDECFHASDAELDEDDAKALGNAITQVAPSTLIALYLGGNTIGSNGLHALIAALHAAPSLETLWVANNQIDNNAAAAFEHLARADAGCMSLKHLAIQKNRMGDESLMALARAVSGGALPQLRWLYAGENEIGDEGVVALAAALEHGGCKQLRRLGLQHNLFGDAALGALGSALSAGAMPDGEFVYVLGNRFTPVGRAALSSGIAESDVQVHFGWPPPKTKSFLITPPDLLAPHDDEVYSQPASQPPIVKA